MSDYVSAFEHEIVIQIFLKTALNFKKSRIDLISLKNFPQNVPKYKWLGCKKMWDLLWMINGLQAILIAWLFGSWFWPKRAGWEGKTFLDSKILNTVWDFSYGWKSMLLGKNNISMYYKI